MVRAPSEGPVGVGCRDRSVFSQSQGPRIAGDRISRDGKGGIVAQHQVAASRQACQGIGPVHDDGACSVQGGVPRQSGGQGKRCSLRHAENARAGQIQAAAGDGQVAAGNDKCVRTAGFPAGDGEGGGAVGDVYGGISAVRGRGVRPGGPFRAGNPSRRKFLRQAWRQFWRRHRY